ncbi:hypothetical protein [Blastomonas sp.]|uniref:hypothetical protein n=1 Tax=Blastomonas sp. TaxID=1909299 RepID=UPI0026044A89|nr:hypothetical protein [Blastomonas sp.]MDM7954762.1 hypothetical protein [Blastomonas sp.]
MDFQKELSEITHRLDTTAILPRHQASDLFRASFAAAFPTMLQGKTYGQASGGLTILNQSEEAFRAELRSIDNDLGRQIAIVNESLDNWFIKGDQPAPYYPWRIAVILGKAKRREEEAAFLAAWCRHFGKIVGGRYEKLADRARKLGAL